jgi:HEAT repeat protein
MDAGSGLWIDLESLIAFAADRPRDDDEVFDRLVALVRSDPAAALDAGKELLGSGDPDRREIGADLIGSAAEIDHGLRARAVPLLRHVLADDTEPGPISAAIVKLSHSNDLDSNHAVVAFAGHPDALVRDAVAAALPLLGLDQPALAALRALSGDEDADVRNWATFGLGQQYEGDDPETRAALLARVEDSDYDVREEAIWGLAFRHDERVRPYLLRELADSDPSDLIREAAELLGPSEA